MEKARAWEIIRDKLGVTKGQELIHLYDGWAETYEKVIYTNIVYCTTVKLTIRGPWGCPSHSLS